MQRARKDIKEILSLRSVVVSKGINIPDFSLNSAEILWIETENQYWIKVLCPMFTGLLVLASGSIKLAGTELRKNKKLHDLLCYTCIPDNYPGNYSLNKVVRMLALRKGLNPAKIWDRCTDLMDSIGCGYSSQLKIKDMSLNTLKKAANAFTISSARLVTVLNAPFEGLTETEKKNMAVHIEELSAEGSAVVIVSTDTPECRTDKELFVGGAL